MLQGGGKHLQATAVSHWRGSWQWPWATLAWQARPWAGPRHDHGWPLHAAHRAEHAWRPHHATHRRAHRWKSPVVQAHQGREAGYWSLSGGVLVMNRIGCPRTRVARPGQARHGGI